MPVRRYAFDDAINYIVDIYCWISFYMPR